MLVRPRDIFHDWYELTARQTDVLLFICQYRHEHGYSPTLRRIGDEFSITSTNGVLGHIEALVRKGAVRFQAFEARSYVPAFRFIPAGELN